MEPDSRKQLVEEFYRFGSIAAPKLRGLAELEDADVDLFEEDSFVAGLVDRFLKIGTLGVLTAIELDPSIDERLRRALEKYPTAEQSIREIQQYRQRVADLAAALSRASGIPLEWIPRSNS